MERSIRVDAEDVLAFLENVNDKEGRIIVDDVLLAKMERVVAALGGASAKEARDTARMAAILQRRQYLSRMMTPTDTPINDLGDDWSAP